MITSAKRVWWEDGVLYEQDIDPADMYLSSEEAMTDQQISDLEAKLADMSGQEVVRYYQSLEVDDPQVDIVAGEMERRGIDD